MRSPNQIRPRDRWVGLCPLDGKRRFMSRSDAKKAAADLFPGEPLSAYRCNGYFHFGHNYRKNR